MDLLKLSIVVLLNTLISCAAHQTNGSTILSGSVEKMLSRRRRTLLLPTYASIKMTVGIRKAILSNRPKGLGATWEICHYYSGPTTVKDLLSSLPHKSTSKSSEASFNTATKKRPQQNHFQGNRKKYPNLLNPHYRPFEAVSTDNYFYPTIFNHSPRTLQNDKDPLSGIHKRSYVGSENTTSSNMSGHDQENRRSTLEDTLDFLLGTDVKCGIVRTICRSTEFLLPQGYSMIQDIIRIMFMKPSHGLTTDGDSLCEHMSHCNSQSGKEYSFNFMDWMLNPSNVF